MTRDVRIRVIADDRASLTFERINKYVADLSVGFGQLGGAAGALSRTMSVAGPLGSAIAATAAAIGSLGVAMIKSVGLIDDLDEAAQGLGVNTIALADMRIAARAAGVESDQLGRVLATLSQRALEAATGNEKAIALFKAIGISPTESGNIKDSARLLEEIADKLRTYRDDANKAAYITELFGVRIGPKLAAFLAQGSEGLRTSSGLLEEQVEAGRRASAEIDKLAAAWERLKFQLSAAAATAINRIFAEPDIDQQIARLKQLRDIEALGLRPDKPVPEFRQKRLAEFDREIAKLEEYKQQLREIASENERLQRRRQTIDLATLKPAPAPKLDREKIDEQTQAFARYVEQLSDALTKQRELTALEEVEEAIAQRRFGALIPQQEEVLRFLAAEIDARRELQDEMKELLRLDEEQQRHRESLEREILRLSGVEEERRKIELTEALEELIPKLGLTREQAERAALGIAGIREEVGPTKSALEELGAVFESAFENALVGGESLRSVLEGLGRDMARIAIRKTLVEPFAEWVKSIAQARDGLGGLFGALSSLFGGLFGAIFSSSSGGGTPASSGPVLRASTGGTVTASKAAAITVVQNNYIDSRTDRADIERLLAQTRDEIPGLVREAQARGMLSYG